MIQRVVAVKLKDAFRSEQAQHQIEAQTLEVLARAHGVIDVQVAFAADARTRREWDFCILVRLPTIADVEIYRTDEVHRAYADVFLAPMRESIRVWNFTLADG